MSDKGRDRAIQLVVLEVSDDFTKHTLLSSTHEHEQKDSSNETRVIVTHNSLSAVNCPIKVEIVPFNWLLKRYLLISQSTHCCNQHTNTNRQRKRSRWSYKYVTEPLALQRTTPVLLQLKFCVWHFDDCQQPRPVNVWFNAAASAGFIVT